MTQSAPLLTGEIRRALADLFDMEELRTLCYDLGVDYDNLPGEGKPAKARELVKLVERGGHLAELVDAIYHERPGAITYDMASEQRDLERMIETESEVLRVYEKQAAKYSGEGNLPADTERKLREQRERVTLLQLELQMREKGSYAFRGPVQNLPNRQRFFGRADIIAEAMEALSPEERGWGVLIDGLGGIGKTALALELAHRSREKRAFEEYIWVSAKTSRLAPEGIQVDEPDFTSAGTMFDAIARDLGRPAIQKLPSNEEKRNALKDALGQRQALLVLVDNLETLSDEDQKEVIRFLRRLPEGCKAIATSRERHGAEEAHVIRLSRLPWEDARQLIENEGRKEKRVQRRLEQEGIDRWHQLYEAVGGSPLAIIWAIGLMRSRHKSFDGVLSMLYDGNQTSDLNRFIYDEAVGKLGVDSRKLLAALSLFPGAADEEALQSVTGLPPTKFDTAQEALSNLSFLVEELDKNLGKKWDLHPVTRRFASTLQVPWGESFPSRYAQYWLEFSQRYGFDDWRSYPKIQRELDNIMAAVNWVYTEWDRRNREDKEPARRKKPGFFRILLGSENANTHRQEQETDPAQLLVDFGNALSSFLDAAGYWTFRHALCEWTVEAANQLGDLTSVGWHSYNLGWLYAKRGDLTTASKWAEQAWKAFKQSGNHLDEAEGRRLMGVIEEYKGDLNRAGAIYKEVLRIYEENGAAEDVGLLQCDMGDLVRKQGDLSAAKRYYERAQAIWQNNRPDYSVAVLNNLGLMALTMNEYPSAQEYFEQALSVALSVLDREEQAQAQWGLAKVEEHKGRLNNALAYAKEAFLTFEELQEEEREQVSAFIIRTQNRLTDRGC